MPDRREVWESGIQSALKKWQSSKKVEDYEVYAITCVTYLCSEPFQQANEHWFCGNPEVHKIAVSSLSLFSFTFEEDSNHPAHACYKKYEARFTEMLASCKDCAIKYQCCDAELMHELIDLANIEEDLVLSFFKSIHVKDRARLAEQLQKNKHSVPVLTEILWSYACLSNTAFVTTNLIEPGILTGSSTAFLEINLAPGLLLLSFMASYVVRRNVMHKILKPGNAEAFIKAWKAHSGRFNKMFSHGLKRNSQTKSLADLAWYTASSLLNKLGEDVSVREYIVKLCAAEMKVARGITKFGGHSLMFQILKSCQPGNPSILTDDDIEKLFDYVTKPKELVYRQMDPDAPEAAQRSESYQSLSASIVTEYMQIYVSRKPSTEKVVVRVGYLLGLASTAFKSNQDFENAASLAAKVSSVFVDSRLIDLVFDQHGQRLADIHRRLKSRWICKIWAYQVDHESKWCSFWDLLLSKPDIAQFSLADGMGTLVGVLQGSQAVALKYKLPTKSENNRPPGVTKSGFTLSRSEQFVKSALEYLVDLGDSTKLSNMLLDKPVLRSVMYLSISGNRELSLAAEEFMKQAFAEDNGDSYVLDLVKSHTEPTVSALNSILKEAAPAPSSWLAVMPGLIRLASTVLDQIYSMHDGVETTGSLELLKSLHVFWDRSWDLVGNVIKNLRAWTNDYAASHVKSLLIVSLEFSESLLAKFRLIDADLSSGIAGDVNWGEKLAKPVIACINNMGDMLQLSIPDLLAMAVSIILEILGLMKSFNVEIPITLMSLLQGLATKRLNSRLNRDQLRDLLSATNLDEQDITDLIEQKRDPQVQYVSSQRQNNGSTISRPATSTQPSIGDFFKSTGNVKPQIQRVTTGSQVLPQTPHQVSGVSLVREQIRQKQLAGQGLPAASRPNSVIQPVGPIHPERPPGFNPKKPQQKLTQSSDEDEGEDDGDDVEGALGSLGAVQKRERAADKLREAYEQSKARKPHLMPETNGASQARIAQQQHDQEVRAMKLRLSAKPTELHRQILSWDCRATRPPFKVQAGIPDRFESVSQYQEIMAPLLFLEAWDQIQNAKEESQKYGTKQFPLIFGKRVKVDGFFDIYVSVSNEVFEASPIVEGDLLALSYDPARPKELVRYSADVPACYALVKDGSVKKFSNSLKNPYVDFQIRVSEQQNFLKPLHSGSLVTGYNLSGLRTLEREFTALEAFPHFELLESILKAKPSVSQDQPVKIARYQEKLSLNRSQAVAISRSLSTDGLSLIQGPPGTGKTKTIMGIIGAYFTTNDLVAQTTNRAVSDTKRILICAPSNAAVDEIVIRLKDGVVDATGKHQNLSLLRLGRPGVVSEEVRDVTLEEIMSKSLNTVAETADGKLRDEHTELIKKRNKLRDRLNQTQEHLDIKAIEELTTEFRNVNREVRERSYALDLQRERLNQARKQNDLQTRQLQNDILKKAQVVCTTLSGAAHPLLASMGSAFETVIVDEAAQCIELSSLIPLKYGCKHCIMVGDPNQLPPTVISQAAGSLKYDQSLFVRIFNQYKGVEGAVSMLDTQFRMHPEISRFPSLEFYDGKLKDASGLSDQLRRPWHQQSAALGPYTFFEIQGHQERIGKSLRNRDEALAAVDLASYILQTHPAVKNIGVISPYRDQVRLMLELFTDRHGLDSKLPVVFNSVDGFQGQEKEIIIFSCVRAAGDGRGSIGFLSDTRRMNVAITRAKTSLWILGNPNSLISNPVWRALVVNAKERGSFVSSHPRGIMQAIRGNESSNVQTPRAPAEELPQAEGTKEHRKSKKNKHKKRKISDEEESKYNIAEIAHPDDKRNEAMSEILPISDSSLDKSRSSDGGSMPHSRSVSPSLGDRREVDSNSKSAQDRLSSEQQRRDSRNVTNPKKVNLFIPSRRSRFGKRA